LVRRDETKIDPMNCGYVTTHLLGNDAHTAGEPRMFDFDGNRVDVVFHDDATGSCNAMIDRQNPLDDPSMFYHGRNRVKWRETSIPPGPWPPVLKMGYETPLVAELWKLNATRDPANPDAYTFTVEGSVTGDDGSGRSDERFVSKSGRVVIEAEDWDVPFSIVALRRMSELPSEFQLDWIVEAQAVNVVAPPAVAQGVERVVTVAQRLTDGKHTLQLDGPVEGIKSLRVYSPSNFPR
jgi:hypothetical protein